MILPQRNSDGRIQRLNAHTAVTLKARVQTIQTKPPQEASDNISLIKRGMAFLTSQLFSVRSMFPMRSRQASVATKPRRVKAEARAAVFGDWVFRSRLARKNSTVRGLRLKA